MDTINLNEQVDIVYDYDVLIIGGGTAGAVAGIAAANEGAKTLIVEKNGALGGSQTMSLVTPIMPAHIKSGKYESYISKEIRKRLTKKGFAYKPDRDSSSWFDTEMLKYQLEEMVVEAGCDILFDTMLVSAQVIDNKKIKSVVVANKGGLQGIRAKQFIDCSGDGDLCVLAGAKYESGNEEGINQSVSLRYELSNVDMDKFSQFLIDGGQEDEYTKPPFISTFRGGLCPKFDAILEEQANKGLITKQDIHYVQMFSMPGNKMTMNFNCPELGQQKNVLDPQYISKKYIEGKQAIMRLWRFYQECIPGFENSVISKFAPMIGIRESRRIITEYFLTTQDILNYTKFNDSIAMSNYPLDIHSQKGLHFKNSYRKDLPDEECYFTIPYRNTIVKGFDNLSVAGRCGGFEFLVQSTARVQHTCRYLGEAAGIGATIAASDNKKLLDVDGVMVRKVMIAKGADL